MRRTDGVRVELFDLDPHKILAMVTDNATNFVKCFMEYARVVNSNSSDTEIRDIESQTIEIELSSHVRCASHTLSLIITSAIEKCLKFKGRGGVRNSKFKTKSLNLKLCCFEGGIRRRNSMH